MLFLTALAFSFLLPFHVRSGSTWSAHRVLHDGDVQPLIPKDMTLGKCRIFADEEEAHPYVLVNTFSVTTPFFSGERMELVTIARDREGRLRFVVLDYFTNTYGWTPGSGVHPSNAQIILFCGGVLATTGEDTEYSLIGNPGGNRSLSKEFAIEANEACFFSTIPRRIYLYFQEDVVGADVVEFTTANVTCDIKEWNTVLGPMTHSFYHPHAMGFLVMLPPSFFLSMLSVPNL